MAFWFLRHSTLATAAVTVTLEGIRSFFNVLMFVARSLDYLRIIHECTCCATTKMTQKSRLLPPMPMPGKWRSSLNTLWLTKQVFNAKNALFSDIIISTRPAACPPCHDQVRFATMKVHDFIKSHKASNVNMTVKNAPHLKVIVILLLKWPSCK